MKYDNLLWSAGACCRFGLRTLACALLSLLSLTAAATQIMRTTSEPPQKPIDQLITAHEIYRHDLAVMDLMTLEITPLTDDATIEQEPTWSPDGKSILYSAIDDAWHELRLLNLETGEKKTVLKEEGVSFTGPDWSPDNRVVFTVRDMLNHRSIELGTGDISESGVQNIIKTPVQGYDPAWGKDNRIYFSGITEIDGSPEDIPSRVLRKLEVNSISASDSTGRTKTPFTILKDYASCQPSFSHDGEKMAFGAHRLGFNDLYIHDNKENKTIQVSDNQFEDRDPAWSPNSKELYFVSDRNGSFQLFSASKRGRETQITENHDFDIRHPAVSPDGKKVIFETIAPITPDAPITTNQAKDTQHLGKCLYNNYTDFTPQHSFRSWLRPLLLGTLNLGTHGELIYSNHPDRDTLAAYQFDNQVALYQNNTRIGHKFCTIKFNGDVVLDTSVLSNFYFETDELPEYDKWQYFKDGKPVMPKEKVFILPEMTEKYASATDADTWAIKLSDGTWNGCPQDMRPLANAFLFYFGESGDMWVKRDVDGKRTINIAHVLKDRSVEILESPEKNNLKVKKWPFAIGLGSPLPPWDGESFYPMLEEQLCMPIATYDPVSNSFINPFRKGNK